MDSDFIRHFSGQGKTDSTDYPNNGIRETVSNGFFVVDQNWTVQYWNRAAEKLLGVTAREITGKNLWAELKTVIPPELYRIFPRTLLKESPVHFEEYMGIVGSWFDVIVYHCDDRASVSFKSIYLPAKIEDLQQQLTHLNGLYRFVTELTNDCLWEWDLLTKEIFWIDGGHRRVFGYQIENALIPQSFWEDRIHPDDKARVLNQLQNIRSVESGGIWEQEYRFKKSDGSYAHVHDKGHIIHDPEITGSKMIGTTQDVTAKKTLELQLADEKLKRQVTIPFAALEAQEKERAEIADELYDNLNQTLCAAKMHIEMAKMGGKTKTENLAASTEYIMEVINELRTVSRRLRTSGMSLGLFDSIRLLVDKLNMQQPVVIGFDENDLVEDDLDKSLQLDIFRMIQELVDNIIKHAGATSAIVDLSRSQNDIILSVSDNGKGCDLSKVKTGMGLTNVLGCAEPYESKISIHSTPGNGYHFKIVLLLSGLQQTFLPVLSDYDE
jgi:PAS domain S-box-containing protein